MKNEIRLQAKLSEPWAIRPQALHAFLAMEDDRMPAHDKEKPAPMMQGAVAIVPLVGVMMRTPDEIDCLMGACSTTAFCAAMNDAAMNAAASAILIDVDSPGGQARGCDEAAEAVRQARMIKPVLAYSGGLMASGAYWAGCNADAVYGSAMSRIGSIGAYGLYRDYSKMFENSGIKSFLLKSGDHKGDFAEGLPITQDMLDGAQAQIDIIGGMFRATVSAARPQISEANMQGQDFMGADALNAGFIDAVCGFNRALADAGTLARLRSDRG